MNLVTGGQVGSGLGFARVLLLCSLLSPGATLGAQSYEALQRAAVLVQEGRLEEADEQAQLALSDPETRAVACSVLGAIRLQQERFDEGAELLQEAVRLEPRLLGAHLSLAQVYTLQGKEEEALEAFRRVLRLDASNLAARVALAGAETEKGNYARSLELALPARFDFEKSPEGLVVLATDYLKTGDRVAAARLAEEWTRLADVPQAWSISFAQLFAEDGLVAEAIGMLEHAERTTPPSYELAFALGGAHLLNGDPARALEAYDIALILRPKSVLALRQAAVVAERRGELERSLSYWLRARRIERDDPEILLGFGRVCLKMDLLDDAEAALTRATELRPDEPAAQYALATAKVGKKQHEEAQALLEHLVAKQPEDAQLQYALGSVLYIRGDFEEAAARLKESLRLQPEQLASRYYLALVARDEGRDGEAIEGLEDVLRRYPDHAASHEALAGLLMKDRRYTDAEPHLRRAVALDPESMKANYQLGLLLARTGRKEESARQLELAKTLREEDEAASKLHRRILDSEL